MAAAHAGQRRRVVAGRILGGALAGASAARPAWRGAATAAAPMRDAVQEIAPRDRAVHAESRSRAASRIRGVRRRSVIGLPTVPRRRALASVRYCI